MLDAFQSVSLLWVMCAAILVFMMQGGFCLLEAGVTRTKNSINVALKNLTDFCISAMIFWLFGYGIMFGHSAYGWIGTSRFMPDEQFFSIGSTPTAASAIALGFFLFQMMFCGTSTTIVSGAVAERIRFAGYLVLTVVLSGLIYPLFGHWAWGGADTGSPTGWLAKLGFVDFAGSTVVHAIGGWFSLAAVIIIGPRLGRFDTKAPRIRGHNLVLATCGVMLLWVGWFGFNGGSTLALNSQVPRILVATNLAAIASCLTALFMAWWIEKRAIVEMTLNGALGGLVAVTASCHIIPFWGAVLLGVGAGVISVAVTYLLDDFKIDDVVSAVPVHAACGLFGTVFWPLFTPEQSFQHGMSCLQQFGVQLLGSGVAFVWAFGVGGVCIYLINKVMPLRVRARDEIVGLNFVEHGASNDLAELMSTMNDHRTRGDFSQHVFVEPHSEVGQIAAEYNRVLDRVTDEIRAREETTHALKSAEEKYRSIFENAVEGIFQTSPSGIYMNVNPALAKIYGYDSPNDLIGSIGDISKDLYVDPQRRAEFCRLIETEGAVKGFVSEVYRRDGSTIWISENAHPVKNAAGRILYYEGSVEDVTEVRRAEQWRAEKAEAEAANEAKSQFLAKMSHEIRTPLNGVIGMLDLLKATSLDDRQKRYVTICRSSADTLLGLINDILDLSKIEAGRMELALVDFDLHQLVEDISEMFVHRAEGKGVELACHIAPDVPQRIEGDPERLRQILVNLVGNALKFTSVGYVLIKVSMAQSPTGEHRLQIHVKDTGIGISPAQQQKLFQPFTQADVTTSRRFGGTGLGLSICRQLADLMQGSIQIESAVGVGTTFTVDLPLTSAEVSKVAPEHEPLAGLRVLLVDDNEINLEILSEHLVAWGCRVSKCLSAETALSLLSKPATTGPAFSIAIIDKQMPGFDGEMLAGSIRKYAHLDSLRILMLTSVDFSDAAVDGIPPWDAWINKPVRAGRLLEMLQKLRDYVPLENARELSAQQPLSETKTPSARILIADDNEVNLIVTTELVRSLGFDTETAADGSIVLEKLKSQTYDLILMDCQMPTLDGFETTRKIREIEKQAQNGEHIPIVALTANAIQGDNDRCRQAGMDGYLTKPIDHAQLSNTLLQILTTHQPVPQQEHKVDIELSSNKNLVTQLSPVSVGTIPQVVTAIETISPAKNITKSILSSVSSDSIAIPEAIINVHQQSIEAVQFQELVNRCRRDHEFALRVLQKFATRVLADKAQFALALAAEDSKTLKSLSHSLKGAAANVGATRLAQLAGNLEEQISDESLTVHEQNLNDLFNEIDTVREWIDRKLLAEHAPASAAGSVAL
ncbi:ammonium transporter [Planctopirus limnophila DSM 3776]|uniref:Sensory/regulatory protein RpfC n=2 Tax=Planctopirus limnophila TaxID=120 RepID=D5SR57_PLAL2|nr:ammonium transporter [Planctopirus limnophila DSM 3776]